MSPVRAIKNQYRGINAHLHSHWQNTDGWDEFHTSHIVHLANLLKIQLLPMGYTAGIEQSLQIRHLGESVGRPKSDVTIFDTDPARASRTPGRLHSPHAIPIPQVIRMEVELTEYRAVAIYEYVPGQSDRGDPVAWIELLSPSNKPGGQDAVYYRDKRLKLLHSGIVFVEVDYLHESSPTFDNIPSYSRGVQHFQSLNGAHPYLIAVLDPRPEFKEGLVYPHGFDADDSIPKVDIPLSARDVVSFDFGAAYHKTFEEGLYGLELVDYSQLPANFDRYSRDDQLRILARMMAILKAARDKVDLEKNAPLPIEDKDIGFDDALSQIQAMRSD